MRYKIAAAALVLAGLMGLLAPAGLESSAPAPLAPVVEQVTPVEAAALGNCGISGYDLWRYWGCGRIAPAWPGSSNEVKVDDMYVDGLCVYAYAGPNVWTPVYQGRSCGPVVTLNVGSYDYVWICRGGIWLSNCAGPAT